jgi:hypothetical protein
MATDKEHVVLEVNGRELRVSSPSKPFFPERGLTKLDRVNLDLALTTAPRACRGAETSAWAGRMRVVETHIPTPGGSPIWCSVKGWLTSYM